MREKKDRDKNGQERRMRWLKKRDKEERDRERERKKERKKERENNTRKGQKSPWLPPGMLSSLSY